MTDEIVSKLDILELFRSECRLDGTLSHRGMAKLAGISDHKALVRGGDIRSQKLAQKLAETGFQAGDIILNGWSIQSAVLCLEYYAFEARTTSEQAKNLFRSFGAVGMAAVHAEAMGKTPAANTAEPGQEPIQKRLKELGQIKDLIDRMDEPTPIILQNFEDRVRDLLQPQLPAAAGEQPRTEWTIRDRLDYREIRGVSNYESAMGRKMAAAYREATGRQPMKGHRVFGGKQRKCTIYLHGDLELMDQVIDEYLAKKLPEGKS